MSHEARFEYLKKIQFEYLNSDRRRKNELLNHAQMVTGMSRKHLIRWLNRRAPEAAAAPIRRGRPRRYGPELERHLQRLWLALEQPCGKKMAVLVPAVLGKYRRHAPDMNDELARQAAMIGAATLDRMARAWKVQRGLCLTKAPTSQWYKSAIPVQPKDWNVSAPGRVQVDTVSHCGDSGHGAFASTLTMTDIHTHWTEMRATWTKNHQGIIRAFDDIERNLPFSLETVKFDSGSEFMNFAVIGFVRSTHLIHRKNKIEVFRSRPYRKNDNCYVEQKNLTHVRQFIGYDRIDCPSATKILDEIYRELWCPFLNFFMPTFKLLRKERIGSRIRKDYEKPKTPYQRILECPEVTEVQKTKLKEQYESLDPFELKVRIEERLQLFFKTLRDEQRQSEALKLAA
jgi:hypothetical protein